MDEWEEKRVLVKLRGAQAAQAPFPDSLCLSDPESLSFP